MNEPGKSVQCSDDMARMPQACQMGQACASDLRPDAETVPRSEIVETIPSNQHSGAHALPRPRDKIKIYGEDGSSYIEAEGLAQALQPGGTIQLHHKTHTKFFHNSKQRRRSNIKNKYKLTESQAEPNILHLDVISAGLAEDWRHLGEFWGFDSHVLDQIRLDYYQEGQHEINYRLLARWKTERAPVTVKMLAEALFKIGRGDLADELHNG